MKIRILIILLLIAQSTEAQLYQVIVDTSNANISDSNGIRQGV
jgi:hypothetical protein